MIVYVLAKYVIIDTNGWKTQGVSTFRLDVEDMNEESLLSQSWNECVNQVSVTHPNARVMPESVLVNGVELL